MTPHADSRHRERSDRSIVQVEAARPVPAGHGADVRCRLGSVVDGTLAGLTRAAGRISPQRRDRMADTGSRGYDPMTDVTTKILEQIRAGIRELGDRLDGLDTRISSLEYTVRGMAADTRLIPEMFRLLRQVADTVADHEVRITRLEGQPETP
jgi:hypothetical protein